MESTLGEGSYGKVFKVKIKESNQIFAMKIVRKRTIENWHMIDQLKNEINIMLSLSHPNIIDLLTYFEDTQNIYFILEVAEEEHLFHRLKKKGKYEEREAAYVIHEIVKAVNYLHTRTPPIIHRDIKPENILFVGKNAKLADFGWSNLKDTGTRTTYCGTPDYLAPEMVREQGHNEKLDIWTIGILTYELLTGRAPFTPNAKLEKIEKTKILEENILKAEVDFFGNFLSEEARDIIY